MKKCLCALMALLTLCLCLPALAGQSYVIDEMLHTSLYDALPRGDGTTLLLYNMRAKDNRTEGENATVACLRCVGKDGETLWEHRQDGPAKVKNIYGKACMLSDGSAMLIYHRYDDSEELWELRKFSPSGELTAQQKLPQDYLQGYFVPGGVLVQCLGQEDKPRELVLYGEDLQPVWRQQYDRAAFRMLQLHSQQRLGEDILILARTTGNVEREIALLLSGKNGQMLWQRKLGPWEDSYFTAVDDDGWLWILAAQYDAAKETYGSAKAVRLAASGEIEQELTLDVSGMGKRERWDTCRATRDGLLVLGRAKTETCARLWRFNLSGKLMDVTDSSAREEEAYMSMRFAELGGELYAATTGAMENKEAVVLLPLTKGE